MYHRGSIAAFIDGAHEYAERNPLSHQNSEFSHDSSLHHFLSGNGSYLNNHQVISTKSSLHALDYGSTSPEISIIVTPPDDPPSDPPPDDPPPPQDDPPGGSGGGGGDPPPPPCPVSVGQGASPDQTLAGTNTLAGRVARDILNIPDVATREYGAVLYTDDNGIIHSSPIYAGNDGAVSLTDGLRFAQQNWGNTGTVVGLIHDHPAQTSGDPNSLQYYYNLFPSGGTYPLGEFTGSDWKNYDDTKNWLDQSGRNSGELQEYIVGPDGQLRDFAPTPENRSYQPIDRVPVLQIPDQTC
ncbi:hypothetical protein [Nitrospirillum sp. BR 11163]|uniref:hypothetical protein n=1 Tax=Nitrospirillum sp. BR 11163 TaxID=3104323 RepID=UPI002AFE695C|nr:hypothetical protein [Nitrospirillum sp. BR 11163]MEA1675433.1 hypothetical protein [Nitrospirillum sp. BR 11163]